MNKYRLTITQQTYAEMEIGENKAGSINLSNGFLLKGKCDLERLAKAVCVLHKRHDAMRMSVGKDEEGFYFVFNDEEPYPLEVLELKSEGREARLAEAKADAMNKVRMPVSLDPKSMYRYWVYKIDEEEYLLYYVANHLATDGGSMALLNAELAKLYENPERTDLGESASYAEFLLEREKAYKQELKEDEKNYWNERIAGYKNPEMEKPSVIEEQTSMEYGTFTIELEKISAVSKAAKTSNFNVLFTLIQLAAAENTGQNDIALRYAFANRFKKKFQGTIGFLTHGVTLRHNFQPDEHWSELISLQKETMNHDMKHLTFSDMIVVQEYVLSYIPSYDKKSGSEKFGDLDIEPLVFHSKASFGRRYFCYVAFERGDYLYATPYCDNRFYSKEYVLNFGKTINKYIDILTKAEDPTVSELFGKSVE